MLRYIIRRILIAIPLLLVASFLSFALTAAMGDPLEDWKIQKPRTAEEVAAQYHRIGYDKPFFDRYEGWVAGFAQGDWKTTISPGRGTLDVKKEVLTATGVTLKLVIGAEVIALLIGMGIGVISAVRQYSIFDYSVTGFAFVMFSMPLFCLALILKFGGININDWLRSIGVLSPDGVWIVTAGPPPGGFSGAFGSQISQYVGTYLLPTICLVSIQFALYSRFQRASMLDVLNADYVRTAQAKGLSQIRVVLRHAFRNALIPVATVASVNLGAIIGGAVITETVFGWSGMGKLLIDAIHDREPYLVLGWMMVVAVFVIMFNLLADILYAYLDPRIRLG